jgi:hypothetical protein
MPSVGFTYSLTDSYFLKLLLLPRKTLPTIPPPRIVRGRQTSSTNLSTQFFVSMGDRQLGRFAHQDRGKRINALSRGRCVALALGWVAQAHRDK